MIVYLAGPIYGMRDEWCAAWREEAERLLAARGASCINPMRNDYRGREEQFAEELVALDKQGIVLCDAMLVSAHLPGWGTAMEVFYAHSLGKHVVVFSGSTSISPWLRVHANHVFAKLEQAIDAVVNGSERK